MVITGHILLPCEKGCTQASPGHLQVFYLCSAIKNPELSDQLLLFGFYRELF